MKSIINWLKEYRLRKAIKQANQLNKLTKFKYFVINWRGVPTVVAKQQLKQLIKQKTFNKHITIEKLEKAALYTT